MLYLKNKILMNPELDSIRKPIDEELKNFEKFFTSYLSSNIPFLQLIINYLLRGKGKQLRPMFVFLSAKMLGNINRSSYVAASMIEMLHTATLVHDDVVDESYERRGLLSINALWKSKIAVLLGDYLLSKGLLIAVENNEYKLLKIISESVKEMIEGEFVQLKKSKFLNINEDEYFSIIKKKTASLISSCTQCGASSVSNDNNIIEKMKLFGEYVGIAFQIKDDLLDYSNSTLIGKPYGIDIQQKKLTLPLIYTISVLPENDKRNIKYLIRNNKNRQNINKIYEYISKAKGMEYAYSVMSQYKNRAIEQLASFPDNEYKTALIKLVEYTISRKK
jgi:octaprenyl-diphosphate synthase